MQNLHLINSYQCPINEYKHQSNDLPLIHALYGKNCRLLFPDLQNDPISVFFSDLINDFLIFYEDEIYIAGKEEPYFTFDFLINFACVSKSGDYALIATSTTPSEVYIFDIDSKDLTLLDLQKVCNFNNVESCQCSCKSNTSNSCQCDDQNDIEKVLYASFRNDNAFCAIATNKFIQTISEKIPEQQGIYTQNVVNPTGVTWNDQGSWLAFSTNNRVVFLEKNCRLRQIYELDDPEAQITALEWSPHRDIIAIMDNSYRIIILSMKNRVFYRKYVINLTPRDDSGARHFVPQLFWSNDANNLSLAVIESISSTVNVYEFNFTVDKDCNSIYVIDGDQLLISDWSRAIIPPPLSHRKKKFGEGNQFNQITAIASNNTEMVVFTLDMIHLLNSQIYLPLPTPTKEHIYRPSPISVQCASFVSDNEIVFACHDILYKLTMPVQSSDQYEIIEFYSNPDMNFISFVSPTFLVTSRANIALLDNPRNPINSISQQITEFVENPIKASHSHLDYVALCHKEGFLYHNEKKIADRVQSFIFFDKLLAYNFISIDKADLDLGTKGWMCIIQFENESSTRQIEPLSQLLYFTPRIFSIITLMNRGNVEVNAPHVVVEAALSEMIKNHQYAEALRVSKKYQVQFPRMIMLGEIDLSILCQQIPDKDLRSCMSVLRPFGDDAKVSRSQEQDAIEAENEARKGETETEERTYSAQEKRQMQHQMSFVLNFLSFILNVKVEYNQIQKTLIIPPYESDQQGMIDFPTTCCICFILLQSPPEAVRFACSFSSSDLVKRSISFLLALYDNDELYDISLKTYDTNCMASVGLITMKEPSLYVPFIEELNQIANENLKRAKIDEKASDPKSAIIHYSLAGSEFDSTALYLIKSYKLFDVGLHTYRSPEQRQTYLQIIQMKLEYLTSLPKKQKEQEKTIKEIAKTAILSECPTVILQHIALIVKANCWQLALPILNKELDSEEKQIQGYRQIRDALENAKLLREAADFTIHYLADKEDAIRIYLQNHDWYKAIELGADRSKVAEIAYQTLMLEATRKAEAARTLKAKFDDVKEKQKIHKDSNVRHGKNKEKRGLPAIFVQLLDLLPNENKKTEFMQIVGLLEMLGLDNQKDELNRAFRGLVGAVWPIQNLPENEKISLPSYLDGFT